MKLKIGVMGSANKKQASTYSEIAYRLGRAIARHVNGESLPLTTRGLIRVSSSSIKDLKQNR